jgi:signal transduction histidine kinase
MNEPRLEKELTSRFSRIVWMSLTGFVLLVLMVFAVVGELAVRSSADNTADVIESLLGLYADPEGTPTGVAPEMLADQLLEMGTPFAITRTAQLGDSDVMVYYLSPGMPAKPLEGLSGASAPGEARRMILMAFAERGRWRYRIQHRPVLSEMGDFDIYVVASRANLLFAMGGLLVAGLGLLPVAGIVTRRSAQHAIRRTLGPLDRVSRETLTIHPDQLSNRVTTPTGQEEITRLAESINGMLDRVEAAQRALKAFTADASHELRTPLTHIKAQAQWCLSETRSHDDVVEAFEAIETEVARTTRMVDDLLLIARGENNQLELDRRPCDLRDLVVEAQEVGTAMASGRDLQIRLAADTQTVALCDVDRTRQIVLNLVANAVKYTPAGSVTLSTVEAGDEVGIRVTDTGLGMDEPSLPKIFDRFYRVDSSRSRALGGAGLGLTIARVLAEVQGGRIDVESRPGEGSVFTLWLPTVETVSEVGRRRSAVSP